MVSGTEHHGSGCHLQRACRPCSNSCHASGFANSIMSAPYVLSHHARTLSSLCLRCALCKDPRHATSHLHACKQLPCHAGKGGCLVCRCAGAAAAVKPHGMHRCQACIHSCHCILHHCCQLISCKPVRLHCSAEALYCRQCSVKAVPCTMCVLLSRVAEHSNWLGGLQWGVKCSGLGVTACRPIQLRVLCAD